MKNFYIQSKKNNIPIELGINSNSNEEISFSNIIIYPKIKDFKIKLRITCTPKIDSAAIIYLFEGNIVFNTKEIISNLISSSYENQNARISFTSSINENQLELSQFNILPELIVSREFIQTVKVELYINNRFKAVYSNRSDFINKCEIICPIFDSKLCKVTLQNNENHTTSVINNNKHFETIVSLKRLISIPIEINEFTLETYAVSQNSIMTILDEDNKEIEIEEIFILYSLDN